MQYRHNIEDYTEVIDHLHYWVDMSHKQKLENGYMFVCGNSYYMIYDNGGETNVMMINRNVYSIPHETVSKLVLAYRIGMYLSGQEIDYSVDDRRLKEVLG